MRLEIDDAPLAASGDGGYLAGDARVINTPGRGPRHDYAAPRRGVGSSFDPDLAVSLDGRRLVYVGTAGGQPQLFVRALDQLEPTPLRGPTSPRTPFLSPDGAWVGFFEGQQTLKKVAITGGPAQTLLLTRPRRLKTCS